jgi:hypothetical protein
MQLEDEVLLYSLDLELLLTLKVFNHDRNLSKQLQLEKKQSAISTLPARSGFEVCPRGFVELTTSSSLAMNVALPLTNIQSSSAYPIPPTTHRPTASSTQP